MRIQQANFDALKKQVPGVETFTEDRDRLIRFMGMVRSPWRVSTGIPRSCCPRIPRRRSQRLPPRFGDLRLVDSWFRDRGEPTQPTLAMKLAELSVLLSLALVGIISSPLAQQAPAGPREALLAANAARFTAMVRQDLAALDTLLAPELTYVHTDGGLQSKAEFLTTLRTGRLRYQSIRPDDLQTRLYGEMGLVTGRSRMRVKAGQELLRFSIRFTALYQRRGTGWVLVAWQATRLPGP